MKKLLFIMAIILGLQICASAAKTTEQKITIYCIGQKQEIDESELKYWLSRGWTEEKDDVILLPRLYMSSFDTGSKSFSMYYYLKNQTNKNIISYSVEVCQIDERSNIIKNSSGKESIETYHFYDKVYKNDVHVEEGDIMLISRSIPRISGAVGVCIRSITVYFENGDSVTMWNGVVLEQEVLNNKYLINYGDITLYDADGKTKTVSYQEKNNYLGNGWYETRMQKVYNKNGDIKVVPYDDVKSYEKQGYYAYVPENIYKSSGETAVVSKNDMGAKLTNNWYPYPVKALYTTDGVKKDVPADSYQNWINAGWGTTSGNAKISFDEYVNSIGVAVNGKELAFDVSPRVVNSRTMVPMRAIFEGLGATVSWEGSTQSIIGEKGSTKIVLRLGNNVMLKNGVEVYLDAAPTAIEGRTFVPVRAIAEALGVSVNWMSDIGTVYISDSSYEPIYTYIFDLYGKRIYVDAMIYDRYSAKGYSVEESKVKTKVYAVDGREVTIYKGEMPGYLNNGWYKEPVIKLYAVGGDTKVVPKAQSNQYIGNGWYKEPVTMLYSKNGQTTVVPDTKVQSMVNSGWYKESHITMYNVGGKSAQVAIKDINSYKNQGWYEYPVVMIYGNGGSTKVIPQSEVSSWKKKGWSLTPIADTTPPDNVTVPGKGDGCNMCNGKGTIKCTFCEGSGMKPEREEVSEKCTDCNGSGRLGKNKKCENCHGSGNVIISARLQKKCDFCTGTGTVKCKSCGGKGK